MTDQVLDVVGIGNAIVDVLSHAGDDFLQAQELAKGTMTLIDAGRAERLYNAMGSAVECSGGAAANTVAGIASLPQTARLRLIAATNARIEALVIDLLWPTPHSSVR